MTAPPPEEVRYVAAEVAREILGHACDRRDTLRDRARFWWPDLTAPERLLVVEQLIEALQHTADLILVRRQHMEEAVPATASRPDRRRSTPRAQD